MKRHTGTLTLALLCGLLAAALPDGITLAAGTPCPGGALGCPEDEVCVDFVCQPAAPCPGCPPEKACGSKADCPSYQDCVGGICTDAELPECGKFVKCPAGETCVGGHCAPCSSGACDSGEPPECRSDAECPKASSCEGGHCVPQTYDPPPLKPLSLPQPPGTRSFEDNPPVWNTPDGDDPFGDVPPRVPQICGADAQGKYVCCTDGAGWSFEKDEVDESGQLLYQAWEASGTAFGRGPVYGNNVHIDRIMPPGYTNSATEGPASNVGGDYWAFSRDVNQQGKWWIGSSDRRSDPSELPGKRVAESATGTLKSPRLLLQADFIRFFIGGRYLPSQRVQLEVYEPDAVKRAALAKLYDGIGVSEMLGAGVQLPLPATAPNYVVVRASAPSNSDEFMHRRVAWDVHDFRGKLARIAIVDGSWTVSRATISGHVNVDEVLCTDVLDDNPTFPKFRTKNGGVIAKVGAKETPIPLWGTTDTHTHAFVNLAFGGNLVWGDPHDELSDVYSCNGSLPEIAEGNLVLRPETHQQAPQQCGASDLLTATVATIPCEAWLGIPFVGIGLEQTCREATWDVTDVLMNQSLVDVHSLHGSPSPLSGGVTITGAREVLQEVTPFMNTFGDIFPSADLPDFGTIAAALPDHVQGLVERLAWDTDDGRHSQHGIKGHALYQKDMIRRAYQGGMRLIGLDVIDSRTITETLDPAGHYNEWLTILNTVLSTRHLVSCGDDPLFPSVGPLCDIAGIARSPEDVRTLVWQNKLAIVLGTETDELGIPRDDATMVAFGHGVVPDTIELQIADLHALGIRKVTAIHALNNPLGGAGIFNDTYAAGTNELSNVIDPGKVEKSSFTLPFFLAGNFTEDMLAIKHWETDPDTQPWTEWYQDHGGWVALDKVMDDDWIGDGVTFEYGFPSVATPLGFAATVANISDSITKVPAFNAKGTWAGLNEVQHLKDVDQLLKGGDMCKLDGAGLPLHAKQAWVPHDVAYEYQLQEGQGFANAVGLRPTGETAIKELMKRGMIIDLDHFSQKARVDTQAVAEQVGKDVFQDEERLYPFFGVHTNSRTHERHGPFPDFPNLRADRGYTAETDRTRPEFERQKTDGGVFSPGANAGYMTDSPEQEPQVRNDCDYSAKSFAHRYLWMMDVMGGRGLTPSTDMSPFFTPAAPRFGQYQCHLRTSYHDDMLGLETAQGEFTHFCPPDLDVPTNQCKSHQFPHDWMPDEPGKEMCKIWGRLLDGCPTHDNLQRQYAEGAGVWYEDYAGRELEPDEQPVQDPGGPQVSYVAARRAWEQRDDAAPRAKVDEIVAIGGARQIWPMKKMKTTAGWKLDQATNTGWDINLDGFQHIGLYPDFLQDVRNVGVSWERMTPMFNAVEDYVRMWERTCELADKWAAKDATVPGCH